MTRTKMDLGAPDHIHAGTDGSTRIGTDWLPDRGVDLVPDFVLVGLEAVECEGVVRSLLVFQHRRMAAALREFDLLDPETRRHPACEFVLIPGSSPDPRQWLERGGTDYYSLLTEQEAPGPMNALARRVFTTVPSGIFVADGVQPELAAFPEAERWTQPRRPDWPSSTELPVFAMNTRPPLLMARTPVVRVLTRSGSDSLLLPATGRYGMSRADVVAWCREWDMRLPTGTEWRFASRGGASATWRWFFGNDESRMPRYAWLRPLSGVFAADGVYRVARLSPNAYGLYDMLGNVDEMLDGASELVHSSYRCPAAEQGVLYPPPRQMPPVPWPDGDLLGFRPVRDLDSRSLRKLVAAGLTDHLFFTLPQAN